MFRLLHNIFSVAQAKLSGRPKPPVRFLARGQVAIMIIVFIAILFVFFAIVLNLGRLAQTKTITMNAATASSAFMASAMASYAEQIYQMQLGGSSSEGADDDLTVCGWTGVAGSILAFIIIAIAIVTGQLELTGWALALWAGLSVLSVVVQLAYVNPGMTTLWNKLMEEIKDPADQFVERAITTALQNSIDDNKQIPDEIDQDTDGLFVGNSTDKINRFGFYYTERLKGAVISSQGVNWDVIQGFLDALGEFVYEGYMVNPNFSNASHACHQVQCSDNPGCCVNRDDNWGMWNPVDCDANPSNPCCGSNPPSECNPCCTPDGTNAGEPNLRPECCSLAGGCPATFTSTSCPDSDPGPSNRPLYVYDPLYEVNQNRTSFPINQFVSFREYLGHDDENRTMTGYTPRQLADTANIWRVTDATGRVFPILWDLSMTRLASYAYDNRFLVPNQRRCRWCDEKSGVCAPGLAGLNLPQCDEGTLPASSGCCIFVNTDPVPDLLTPTWNSPAGILNDTCYDDAQMYRYGWWKRGANQYCSSQYPYNNTCPGQYCFDSSGYDASPPPTCTCCGAAPCCTLDNYPASPGSGENNECLDAPTAYRPYWVEDSIDGLRYNMDQFIAWADRTLKMGLESIGGNFTGWYPETDDWINNTSGVMREQWYPKIDAWVQNLNRWVTSNYNYSSGSLCPPSPSSDDIAGIIGCYNDPTNGPIATNQALDQDYMTCYNACTGVNPPGPGCSGTPPCGFTVCNQNCRAYCTGLPIAFVRRGPGIFNDMPSTAFVCNVWRRHIDAMTNAAKYTARRDYLAPLYNQTVEARDKLAEARDKINAFLNDPRVEALRDEADQLVNNAAGDPVFEPYAIYGWQSDPPPGRSRGYWHIVRVDARLPGRCDGRCGREHNGTVLEPGWPYVKTYTKNWGTRRCYTLGDNFDGPGCPSDHYHDRARECFWGGAVKTRVVRYDEDKDLLLKFANAVPIWRFIASHPLRERASPAMLDNVTARCLPDPETTMNNGAFMLNDVSLLASPQAFSCWAAVAPLLERGVQSKVCAEYFFHQDPPRGFDVKFKPCREPF